MIYTGYWAKIKEYESQGLIPVGISGKMPDGFNGVKYQQLAPKYVWWRQWHDENMSNEWYVDKYYETILNQLNPVIVFNDLQKIGKDIILLCYETPEKFCHRHIVAKWLNEKLNLNICEYKCSTKKADLFNL